MIAKITTEWVGKVGQYVVTQYVRGSLALLSLWQSAGNMSVRSLYKGLPAFSKYVLHDRASSFLRWASALYALLKAARRSICRVKAGRLLWLTPSWWSLDDKFSQLESFSCPPPIQLNCFTILPLPKYAMHLKVLRQVNHRTSPDLWLDFPHIEWTITFWSATCFISFVIRATCTPSCPLSAWNVRILPSKIYS